MAQETLKQKVANQKRIIISLKSTANAAFAAKGKKTELYDFEIMISRYEGMIRAYEEVEKMIGA